MALQSPANLHIDIMSQIRSFLKSLLEEDKYKQFKEKIIKYFSVLIEGNIRKLL